MIDRYGIDMFLLNRFARLIRQLAGYRHRMVRDDFKVRFCRLERTDVHIDSKTTRFLRCRKDSYLYA